MVTVVKIGGSLFPEYTTKLCEKLYESKEQIVLINGGGQLANDIREFNKIEQYSNDINHWSAIKCMDIIGQLIADKNKNISPVIRIKDIPNIFKKNKIPLLLSYELLKSQDPLKHTWDITSDSIACWLANQLNAKLLILTNVDGIYDGNISHKNKKLINEISANKLLLFNESSVDKCLPRLLIKYHLDCYVMNGKHPARVLNHLNSITTMNNNYTHILGGK
jgi:aspartokinase-like uncharacterized kinase